jgi:hypothetical protein
MFAESLQYLQMTPVERYGNGKPLMGSWLQIPDQFLIEQIGQAKFKKCLVGGMLDDYLKEVRSPAPNIVSLPHRAWSV